MKIGDKVKTPEGETMIVVSSPTSKVIRVGTPDGVTPYREEFIHADELRPARKRGSSKGTTGSGLTSESPAAGGSRLTPLDDGE